MSHYKIVARTSSGAVHVLQLFTNPPVTEDLDKWAGYITSNDVVDVDHNGLGNSPVRVFTRNIEAIAIKDLYEDF